MAASPAVGGDAGTVSSIQAAIVESADTDRAAGADFASAFGNAFTLAMQSVGGEPGSGKTAQSPPPPPPVTVPYAGQSFN